MGKHTDIRSNKTCQNCGHFVEQLYCPSCGQANVESRKSFAHLISHFAADIVHYDSYVWTTLRRLIFSPGYLSTEYMKGRRKAFVDPAKLYIFLSFITFIIPTFTATSIISAPTVNVNGTDSIAVNAVSTKNDSLINQLDRQQSGLEEDFKASTDTKTSVKYYALKSVKQLLKHKNDKEKIDQFVDHTIHYTPKALFFYMPIFAFILWLFHIRKRRYYFDSGIFTLHYFSFSLISLIVYFTISSISEWLHLNQAIPVILYVVLLVYATVYYYIAAFRFYEDKMVVSIIKSTIIMAISTLIAIIISTALLLYAFVKVYEVL